MHSLGRKPVFTLTILLLLSIQTQVLGRAAARNATSTQRASRTYGGTAKFQDAGWNIWDRPEDQIAIEAETGKEVLTRHDQRAGKQQSIKPSRNFTGKVSYDFPEEKGGHNSGSYGMKRQGCNANLQVSILPIILAIIAVVAGVIGVFVLWIIAKSFFTIGGSGGSSHLGTGIAQPLGSGWSNQQRQDLLGFTRSLKNIDFDQLTQLVSKAVEKYHSIFDTKQKKS